LEFLWDSKGVSMKFPLDFYFFVFFEDGASTRRSSGLLLSSL
jgi:hypothetical protein